MALKRFKFELMFILDINDITSKRVGDDLRTYRNYEEIKSDPVTYEIATRHRNLLYALLRNEEVLRDYAKRLFADSLCEADYKMRDYFSFDGFLSNGTQLKNIVRTLGKEDRQYFEEAIKYEVFLDDADHFDDSFKFRLADVTMSETD